MAPHKPLLGRLALPDFSSYASRQKGKVAAKFLGGIRGKSSSRGQKFVTVDAGGNASPAVVGFDAHNFRKASNVDIAGHSDFTGQGENEFDGRTRREVRFNQKIEAAETDVPRLSLPFVSARLGGTNR